MTIDKFDLAILKVLQEDARASLQDIQYRQIELIDSHSFKWT